MNQTFTCNCGGEITVLYSSRKSTPIGHCDRCHKWFDVSMSSSTSPWTWKGKPVPKELSSRYQKFLTEQKKRDTVLKFMGCVVSSICAIKPSNWFEFRSYRRKRGMFLRVGNLYLQLYVSRKTGFICNAGTLPVVRRI